MLGQQLKDLCDFLECRADRPAAYPVVGWLTLLTFKKINQNSKFDGRLASFPLAATYCSAELRVVRAQRYVPYQLNDNQ